MQDATTTIQGEPPCPPTDAVPADGAAYYRCCCEPTGDDSDFLSAKEEGTFATAPTCERRALSVMGSKEDAFHWISLQPRRGWRHVMVAHLIPTHGHIKHTPRDRARSHSDWWPSSDLDPSGRAALFSLVEDDDE